MKPHASRCAWGAMAILGLAICTGIIVVSSPEGALWRPAPASAGTGLPQREVGRTVAKESVPDGPPLRVAVSAAFVPEAGVGTYRAIADHLSKRLGLRLELLNGLAYGTIDEMIDSGAIQLAFVCGLPYVRKMESPAATVRLVAAPVMTGAHYGGQPKYFSYAIVRAGLEARGFADLKGLRFAYSEESSNSGYNMPRARLIELGETGGFFRETLRSGSHEESIRMVAEGKADTACVDSLIFDYMEAHGAPEISRVRVIERLGPAGIPPLVASARLDEEMLRRVREVLLGMHEDPEGRRILAGAMIARFVAVDDSNYEDVRRMWRAAQSTGFLRIR